MEYFGNCPKCGHHTIVKTVKTIKSATERNPQRVALCGNCGETSRITIIGEIVKLEKPTQSATTMLTEEYDPELNSYSLRIKLWK